MLRKASVVALAAPLAIFGLGFDHSEFGVQRDAASQGQTLTAPADARAVAGTGYASTVRPFNLRGLSLKDFGDAESAR